jgi:hypothetical protein
VGEREGTCTHASRSSTGRRVIALDPLTTGALVARRRRDGGSCATVVGAPAGPLAVVDAG